jgi:hypothetical protein
MMYLVSRSPNGMDELGYVIVGRDDLIRLLHGVRHFTDKSIFRVYQNLD